MLAGSKTGMDVYRHIRRINSSVPVLFVSGNIEWVWLFYKTANPFVFKGYKQIVMTKIVVI
jgi:hypothetical protein